MSIAGYAWIYALVVSELHEVEFSYYIWFQQDIQKKKNKFDEDSMGLLFSILLNIVFKLIVAITLSDSGILCVPISNKINFKIKLL